MSGEKWRKVEESRDVENQEVQVKNLKKWQNNGVVCKLYVNFS